LCGSVQGLFLAKVIPVPMYQGTLCFDSKTSR
jgi:hypothetical protein